MHRTFKYLILLPLCLYLNCQSDSTAGKKTDAVPTVRYGEPHRPQFHFSPEEKWMGPPNGLVYLDGEYHLFYPFNPDGLVNGATHWGHAVSQDMVSWKHLPVALSPDGQGYIVSGSVVVDLQNSSGLGVDGQPPMVALVTQQKDNETTQNIAYSNDKGHSWTKFESNPVLKGFNDPKVFWHEESKKWVMVLAAGDRIKIYNSPDLKDWTAQSEFGESHGSHGGNWSAPDLFPLRVGGRGETKWVMLTSVSAAAPNGGSGMQYFIGDFDGKAFIDSNSPETQLWVDYGKDVFAGSTWSNLPREERRQLFIGWMGNLQYAENVPTDKWRGAMTVPRYLDLMNTDKGLRLTSRPVTELKSYRSETFLLKAHHMMDKYDLLYIIENRAEAYEVALEFERPTKGKVEVKWANAMGEYISAGYDADAQQYFIDRQRPGKTNFGEGFAGLHRAGESFGGPTIKMQLFFDKSSVELFADDGKVVMTDVFFPSEDMNILDVFTSSPVNFIAGKIYPMKSIWR